MKVGDLVVKTGWEHQGAGIVIKVWGNTQSGPSDYATIRWPSRVAAHPRNQLEVISESR